MKILFYINTIHPGGAERVMVNLAGQFAANGDNCILVTSYKDDVEYQLSTKVRRINLFEQAINGVLKRNYLLTAALRKQIKIESPDVVISFMAEPNFRALVASMGLRTRNIISVRNDPNREYGNPLFRVLAKTLFCIADGVVFQTRDAQAWFPKAIQKKSRIIFNQVDEKFYQTQFSGQRRNVVTTGRLAPQKNHAMLIRAFAGMAHQVEDNLVIYGEGALRDDLETLIAELGMEQRIFLPGSTKDVATAIAGAKLFVLSSDFEGMPNSLMEAMALGLPCISTDCPCGGPGMLIEHEKNGVLVPVDDQTALKEAMERVLLNPYYAEELCAAANKSAQSFCPARVFEQWRAYVGFIAAL